MDGARLLRQQGTLLREASVTPTATFPAQTQSGNYRGEIIGETELHVVQRAVASDRNRPPETSTPICTEGRRQRRNRLRE